MAFTVVTTWDFRGSDSDATKRVSRIGSYTLTENGTPTYSTDGVTFNATDAGLTLTLPAELKYATPFWIMGSIRRVGSNGAFRNVFGFVHNNTSAVPYDSMVFSLNQDQTTGGVSTNDGTSNVANFTAGGHPALNTDYVATIKRLQTSATLHLDGGAAVATASPSGWPAYASTAHLAIGDLIGVSRNSAIRCAWLIIGTGDITTAEMATIQASPNTYIYPSAPAVSRRPFTLKSTRRAYAAPRRTSSILSGVTRVVGAGPATIVTPRNPTVVRGPLLSPTVLRGT